jgi:putative hydrolase of the HAD superfamily
MKDDPASSIPMVEWPQVWAVEGISDLLAYLQSSGRRCILATSADISDEAQIRAALARVGLDGYFQRIYSFKNTGIPKSEAFYQQILSDLGLPASDALMVGDSFEKDVLAANRAGIRAAWFHPGSQESRESTMHTSFHSMAELREYFTVMDRAGGAAA